MSVSLEVEPSRKAARDRFDDFLGRDPNLLACLNNARRAAQSESPILITGESGTGKEVLARAIHAVSSRSRGPFVAVNMAAIPRELLESELFGYEPGAFTGARRSGKPGLFEQADGGTILLDEIGDMPLDMQGKLLRVLQERVVQRLGGSRERSFDARVIASTNVDLEEAIQRGSFRLDVYHRICVVNLHLPPLRERSGDIPLLLEHFLAERCRAAGRPPVEVTPAVLEQLSRYPWPGNVRELANVAEGWITLLPPDRQVIDRTPQKIRRHLPSVDNDDTRPLRPPIPMPAEPREEPILPMWEVEKRAIASALRQLDGNVARVARALEVSRATVYNKMKKYGLV